MRYVINQLLIIGKGRTRFSTTIPDPLPVIAAPMSLCYCQQQDHIHFSLRSLDSSSEIFVELAVKRRQDKELTLGENAEARMEAFWMEAFRLVGIIE